MRMESCEYLSVGDRGIVSQRRRMRKSGSSMRNISGVVTREPTAAATALRAGGVRSNTKRVADGGQKGSGGCDSTEEGKRRKCARAFTK